MIEGLTWTLGAAKAPPPSFAPPAVRDPVYAIGPVRGEAKLLRKLVARILRDLPRRPSGVGFASADNVPARRRQPVADLVLLGNLACGGAEGLDVFNCLADIVREPALRLTVLLGPQELRMRRFLAAECDSDGWLRTGGVSLLVHAGVDPRLGSSPLRLRAELAAALGPRRALIEGMPPSIEIGNLLFSHGGGAEERSLEAQEVDDLVMGPAPGERAPRRDGIWTVHAGPLAEPAAHTPGRRSGMVGLCSYPHVAQRLVALRIDTDGGFGFLEVNDVS